MGKSYFLANSPKPVISSGVQVGTNLWQVSEWWSPSPSTYLGVNVGITKPSLNDWRETMSSMKAAVSLRESSVVSLYLSGEFLCT